MFFLPTQNIPVLMTSACVSHVGGSTGCHPSRQQQIEREVMANLTIMSANLQCPTVLNAARDHARAARDGVARTEGVRSEKERKKEAKCMNYLSVLVLNVSG